MRYRARRVVVKARVVKLKGIESQAIATHLRYLQREGVTADGQHGQAYSGRTTAPTPGPSSSAGWRTATSSGSSLPPKMASRSGSSNPLRAS